MRFRNCLWTLLAAAHLVVVVCGANGCLPGRTGAPLAYLLRWYAQLSGADSQYGFFAPEVGSEQRARFLLQDDEGCAWSETIDQAHSPEARLRLINIVESPFMSGTAAELPEWRQELVKSWAATMFSRHPRAVSLTIVVEAYDVPTMAEFRAGQAPSWKVVYEARVQRGSRAANERTEP
jgi:hypothetical protein